MPETMVDRRDFEIDAQLTVLAYKDDDGEAFIAYCESHNIPRELSLALGATLFPYLIAHDEYRANYDRRVEELSKELNIEVPEGEITPGCKCDYCEYARISGRVKDPEVTQKVFIPNLEQDAIMTAIALDNDNDKLEAACKNFGLSVDEGIIRGTRLAVYLLDNPDYKKALETRVEELVAERQETRGDEAKEQAVRNLGLDPSEELIEFIDTLTEDAKRGGALSKPYLASGAIVIHEATIPIPGIGDFVTKSINLHKTKFKEVYLGGGSSQMNS